MNEPLDRSSLKKKYAEQMFSASVKERKTQPRYQGRLVVMGTRSKCFFCTCFPCTNLKPKARVIAARMTYDNELVMRRGKKLH